LNYADIKGAKMTFKNLKIRVTKVEGKCTWAKVGTSFYIKNAKLEIPPGQNLCVFALGSILQPITGAMMNTEKGEGILDVLQEWRCPEPFSNVIFKIEEIA
jgi:uncharacterized repeat protein (TIGR04076 family)